jgi:hypothetical protein
LPSVGVVLGIIIVVFDHRKTILGNATVICVYIGKDLAFQNFLVLIGLLVKIGAIGIGLRLLLCRLRPGFHNGAIVGIDAVIIIGCLLVGTTGNQQ